MDEHTSASASPAGQTPVNEPDDEPAHSDRDVQEAYQAVIDHIDDYATAEERHAFADAAMSFDMYLTDGTLPGSFGVRYAGEPDRQ